MAEPTNPVDLAERVARIAGALQIETALVGAYALAAHHYVRGTKDVDLGTAVPLDALRRLQHALDEAGLHTLLRPPDEEDPLGGVLVVGTQADEAGDRAEARRRQPARSGRCRGAAGAQPGADLEEIRATCQRYGLDLIDALIDEAHASRGQ